MDTNVLFKICTKCKIKKNIIEFSKDNKSKDLHRCDCKECRKIFIKNYKYNSKKYYKEHKEVLLLKKKDYYDNNKSQILLNQRIYRKSDKGKVVSINKTNKRRTIGKIGDVSSKQLLEFKNKTKKCYWCGCDLKNVKTHIDHYIPLSKGGEHTINNLVVSCEKCNLNKHAKDPIEFANSIGKLF